jgi:predicted RNA-binding Zn-ribbon protein involved in translation (DUF1610 family)
MESVDRYIERTDEEMRRMYGVYVCPNCKGIHDYFGRCPDCGRKLINMNDVMIEDEPQINADQHG